MYYNKSMSYTRELFKRRSAAAVAGVAIIALTTLLTGCPDETSSGPSYICENGTPVAGTAPTDNSTGCQKCSAGFALDGQAGAGTACGLDTDGDGVPNSIDPDDDNDGTLDTADVDDDNDGLIEISSLEQLHNMRYDLAGTSYKTSSTATADRTGGPSSATADCTTATSGVYLCGYELTQNLDFDLDGDGSTYTESPPGTYTLDDGDNARPHFVTSAGGWEPITDTTMRIPFAAVFDGNGFTIANMAIIGDADYLGLFATISIGTVIRNVGLLDVLIDSNAQTSVFVGGLVGEQADGIITASYATATIIDRRSRLNSYVGGLVGSQLDGAIIASYAAGNISHASAALTRYIGGLVGYQTSDGAITASYASTSVNGSNSNEDYVGGLVGYQNDGTITASYATGNVNGGSGNEDQVGGLVGFVGSAVTASYATGSVNGGETADTGDFAGNLAGIQRASSYIIASYGFGNTANGPAGGVSTMPSGVTAATGLTVANTGGSGCDLALYTTQAACVATSKAPGVWSTTSGCSPPMTGATSGVTYTELGTRGACEAGTKTASTWITVSWDNAANNTRDAWVFAAGKTPKLRYADYDGSGTTFACSLFPSTVTCGASGDLLSGQPAQ